MDGRWAMHRVAGKDAPLGSQLEIERRPQQVTYRASAARGLYLMCKSLRLALVRRLAERTTVLADISKGLHDLS